MVKSNHHTEILRSLSWFGYSSTAVETLPNLAHTIQDSFYKWTKISSHEIDIFGLKVVVKSGLGKIILNFTEPLQSAAAQCKKNLPGKAELAWQVTRYL